MSAKPLTKEALERLRSFREVTAKDDTRISRYAVEPATYGDVRALLDAWDAERARAEKAEAALDEERDAVNRVWESLGITTYAQAGGKSIYEIAAEQRAALAAAVAERDAWRAADDERRRRWKFTPDGGFYDKARLLRDQSYQASKKGPDERDLCGCG